jgi:photosynthetic reaction center cytochrome c subunit
MKQPTFNNVPTVTLLLLCTLLSARSQGQTKEIQNQQLSESVFKNVQVLRGLPVDEFMDTMGMFASSLGYDCASCHDQGISSDRAAFAIATPSIQRARQMILMMNALNRANFGGEQRVTCFTCHRGNYTPETIPNLALQYGELTDDPNAMIILPDRNGSADPILQKYIQALGGADRLAKISSFVARGTYTGFTTGGAGVPVEIFAKAPDERAQIIHMPEGNSVKTYDGHNCWVAEKWRPLPLMPLTGGNLEGARLDALMSFPAQIRKAYSKWQVTSTIIDDRKIQVLQGTSAGQLPVNLYFDDSGLLVRQVRWNKVSVGIIPTQIDYSNYREVGGVKMPFHTVVTWTDGQDTFELTDIQVNVPIDPGEFAMPSPFPSH